MRLDKNLPYSFWPNAVQGWCVGQAQPQGKGRT